MGKENIATWLPFWATIASVVIAGVLGFVSFWLEQRAKRRHEILQERKEALFEALSVIDYVYATTPLNNVPPLNPKEWDIDLARRAMNKILIYCKDPQRTVAAFNSAIGLHNPEVEKGPGVQPKYLDEFRKRIACELDLPEYKAADPNRTWIYSVNGTKEAKELERRNRNNRDNR